MTIAIIELVRARGRRFLRLSGADEFLNTVDLAEGY